MGGQPWTELGNVLQHDLRRRALLTGCGDVVRHERAPALLVRVAPGRALSTQTLPATMFDLDTCREVALVDKGNFHLGRIGAVAAQVPQIGQPRGRLPDRDFAPLEFDAGQGPLENAPTGSPLEHHLQPVFAADTV